MEGRIGGFTCKTVRVLEIRRMYGVKALNDWIDAYA